MILLKINIPPKVSNLRKKVYYVPNFRNQMCISTTYVFTVMPNCLITKNVLKNEELRKHECQNVYPNPSKKALSEGDIYPLIKNNFYKSCNSKFE